MYTPTPVITWDPVADTDVAGYKLYYSHYGTVWMYLTDLPCWSEDDGTTACPITAAVQKYCPLCEEYKRWYFCVKAYDSSGLVSSECSDPVSVCWTHIWIKPEPYN